VQIEMTDDSDETDGFFGFVAGFYTAALTAPAVAIAVALGGTTDPGALFFVLLGTAVVAAGGVGWLARRRSLAVRLGSSRWIWTAMALPFGYFAVLFAVEVRGENPPSAVAGLAVLGALAGLLAGVGLVAASHNRHAKAMLADAETLAEFTAPAPDRDRRMVKRAVVGLFGVSLLGFVASAVTDFAPLRWLFQILAPTAAGLWGSTTDRTVAVSDAGLVAGNPVHKRFRPWPAFESYDVTDEAIVVRRSGWSAWGLLDVRRDPAEVEEVEDPEEIAAALGEYLPREQ
jgi:hypothetical protein